MDLAAVYDPDLELGAIVDTDEMRALGPVGGGPNAKAELQAFINAMPAQVFSMKPADLVTAWMQFWSDNFAALYRDENESDTAPVVPLDGAGSDAARLAEREAVESGGEPPPPAPADSDPDASEGEADTVGGGVSATDGAAPPPADEVAPYEGPCFACNGAGTVPGVTDGEPVQCNLCKGTGRITASAAV